MHSNNSVNSSYVSTLVGGASAGVVMDVTFYPLDTLKTRLQSAQGFRKAGGFKGVYRGLTTVASVSLPATALFFTSYELTKDLLKPHVPDAYLALVPMAAAGVAETVSCTIRVPMEIAKQRKQTYVGRDKKSATSILIHAYKSEGIRRGLYRGYLSTIARDVPFGFIDLPLWEYMKNYIRERNGECTSFQSAICGGLAGSFAGAITTPLDLAKTRIMLASEGSPPNARRVLPVLRDIYKQSGFKGLFAGIVPRCTAFIFAGFVFFGVYDDSKRLFEKHFLRETQVF